MSETTGQSSQGVEAQTRTTEPSSGQERKRIILVVAGIVLVIALLIIGIVLLVKSGSETTSLVRDIFIIFMALESLVIGAALVIMIIQLSVLINLIQNEFKPILNATIDTVNTLRGTTEFISDNLAEPVIRLNEYLAMFKKFFDVLRPRK